jgi:hypothetical protein
MSSDWSGASRGTGFQNGPHCTDHILDNSLIVEKVAAQQQYSIPCGNGTGILLNTAHPGFREHPLKALAGG